MDGKTKDQINREEIKRKNFVIIVLLIFLLISIGYALLSSTLGIPGQTTVGKSTWDIHFENISDTSKKVQVLMPATIQGNTTDVRYQINLLEPGSYYEFDVDIKNAGTIDAKIENEPAILGISQEQATYTNYTVTYKNGSKLKIGDVIKAGETQTITVRIEIKDDLTAEQLPSSYQSLNLTLDLDYVQSSNND